jgi:hypothetical protein
METLPRMTNDQVVSTIVASLVALAATFIYVNAVLQSLINDDRRGSGRLAAAAIACLSLAVIVFQADRLRFLLFTGAYNSRLLYELFIPNLLWAGIPVLTHGLVLLFRNNLQLYRVRKSSYSAWRPDAGDWFIGGALVVGGAALLWQWHPTYLPAAVGWTIAVALCAVVSIALWRWSAKE